LDSSVESTEKMLGEIKRIVKEAIEESKREDIIKLGTAIEKIADVLKSMLEELKKHTEILEKHTKILEEHSGMLKEHGKTLMELKIAVGNLGKRVGRDLEKMILSLYKDNLAQLGIDPEKARRFIYTDLDGKLGVRASLRLISSDINRSSLGFLGLRAPFIGAHIIGLHPFRVTPTHSSPSLSFSGS